MLLHVATSMLGCRRVVGVLAFVEWMVRWRGQLASDGDVDESNRVLVSSNNDDTLLSSSIEVGVVPVPSRACSALSNHMAYVI